MGQGIVGDAGGPMRLQGGPSRSHANAAVPPSPWTSRDTQRRRRCPKAPLKLKQRPDYTRPAQTHGPTHTQLPLQRGCWGSGATEPHQPSIGPPDVAPLPRTVPPERHAAEKMDGTGPKAKCRPRGPKADTCQPVGRHAARAQEVPGAIRPALVTPHPVQPQPRGAGPLVTPRPQITRALGGGGTSASRGKKLTWRHLPMPHKRNGPGGWGWGWGQDTGTGARLCTRGGRGGRACDTAGAGGQRTSGVGGKADDWSGPAIVEQVICCTMGRAVRGCFGRE